MRHLGFLALGVLLIAATGNAGAGAISPAGFSKIDGLSLVELVLDSTSSKQRIFPRTRQGAIVHADPWLSAECRFRVRIRSPRHSLAA